MKKKNFIIGSLAIAGLSATPVIASPTRIESENSIKNSTGLFTVFSAQKEIKTANHRSHQSHSSHGSHRSSSSGSRSYPSAIPTPTPRRSESTTPSSILPRSSFSNQGSLSATEKFVARAKRVQQGLTAYGYYSGEIDGKVGPATKAALSKFQKDFSLTITGTITPEVLDAFGIT